MGNSFFFVACVDFCLFASQKDANAISHVFGQEPGKNGSKHGVNCEGCLSSGSTREVAYLGLVVCPNVLWFVST